MIKNSIPKGNRDSWCDNNLRYNYNLNKDSIVIDLGGYLGEFTEGINLRYNCNIHTFEPIQRYFDVCKDKFKTCNNIKIYRSGLSHNDEIAEFTIEGDSSNMFFGVKQEKVKLIKIDDFLKKENLESVDLLKMNIEGAEYDLLIFLIQNELITRFKNIQIQFHENVYDGWREKYDFIIENLSKTHHLTYHFEFKFENWEIN